MDPEDKDVLDVLEILDKVPQKDALLLADALLFAVYGWTPDRIKRMKISSIRRWVGFAKERLAWGDAYKLRTLLERKERSWWKKLLKINS